MPNKSHDLTAFVAQNELLSSGFKFEHIIPRTKTPHR